MFDCIDYISIYYIPNCEESTLDIILLNHLIMWSIFKMPSINFHSNYNKRTTTTKIWWFDLNCVQLVWVWLMHFLVCHNFLCYYLCHCLYLLASPAFVHSLNCDVSLVVIQCINVTIWTLYKRMYYVGLHTGNNNKNIHKSGRNPVQTCAGEINE